MKKKYLFLVLILLSFESINAQKMETQSINFEFPLEIKSDIEMFSEQNPDDLSVLKLKSSQLLNGVLVMRVQEIFDTQINEWVNYSKNNYTHDSNGNTTQWIYSDWNVSTNQWVNSKKYDFFTVTNNSSGTRMIISLWDININLWINSSKSDYSLNTNGTITQSINYVWDVNIGQWNNSSKSDYSLDSNGTITQSINYIWDVNMGQWNNSSKNEYTYDSNGNRTQIVDSTWDLNIEQWVNSKKRNFTYNFNGNLTQDISAVWDISLDQWVNSFKNESTFDSNGNRSQWSFFDWDVSINQWVNSTKIEYTYDSNDNKTQVTVYEWDLNLNLWIIRKKADYTYDINGNRTQDISYMWNNNTKLWTNSSRTTFYYSDSSSEVTAIPDANFEQALIDLGIDSDGVINQSVLTSDISSVTELDVSNKNISDLTGIDDFVSLDTLVVKNNQLITIPASISNLKLLKVAIFTGNRLNGEIPNFGSISTLKTLDISRNNLSFADLETNYDSNNSIDTYNYQNQGLRDTEISLDGIIGNNYTLSMTPIEGTNVSYQWYKKRYDYFDASDELINGAANSAYQINNLQGDGYDKYFCVATSQIITDLIIERNTIDIKGEIPQLQKDALIAIYNSTGGENWTNSTNWLSNEPVSTWYGVKVQGNYISELRLGQNNLKGSLPSEISNLSRLQVLIFYPGADLSGPIPSEIGNLTELRILSLEFCKLTGEIPTSFSNLKNIRGLWIDNNELTGNFPEFINTLSNQTFIDISFNNFEGKLPDFTGLQKLVWLNVANNHFYASDISEQLNDYLYLERTPWTNNMWYSPQSPPESEPITQSAAPGTDIVLSVNNGSNKSGNKTAASPDTYQWFKDGVAITNATSDTYTIVNAQESDSGVYNYEIYNADMPDLVVIGETITVDINSALGVDDELLAKSINLYPNPVSDILTIDAKLPILKVEIYSILGNKVKEIKTNFKTITTHELSSGIYLLRIESEKGIAVKKLIKQ